MSSNDVFMLAAVASGLVVTAFISALSLCLLVRYLSPRIGFVDRPGGHKGHRLPTPLGGGVAIWLTTVGILATRHSDSSAVGEPPAFPSRSLATQAASCSARDRSGSSSACPA